MVNQINEYQNTVSRGRTYTKNPVVYGAPGSGKSFVGAVAVLYSITQGLNTMTTALMAVRANALGGIHLHEFFKLSTSGTGTIYQKAEQTIEKIKRKSVLYHALLTLDILFVNEARQVSSKKLRNLDIIIRKGR